MFRVPTGDHHVGNTTQRADKRFGASHVQDSSEALLNKMGLYWYTGVGEYGLIRIFNEEVAHIPCSVNHP